MVVFALDLPVEPTGKIAQCFNHDIFGIAGHVLPGRAVASHRDCHAVFVAIVITLAGFGAMFIKIAQLDRLQGTGDAVQFSVLRRVRGAYAAQLL